MPPHLAPTLHLLLALLVVSTAGCGQRFGDAEVRPARCQFPPSEETQSTVPASGFTKPTSWDEWRDRRPLLSREGHFDPGSRSNSVQFFDTRDHLRPNGAGTQTWLAEGEHAIFDFGYRWHSDYPEEGPARVYDLYVFVDFQLVPFRLIRVDGRSDAEPFPDRREAVDAGELGTHETLRIPQWTPKAYTLVIPPESLGERGAHDLRIVRTERQEPNPDSAVPVSRFYHSIPHPDYDIEARTLNYGGERFAKIPDLPTMDAKRRTPPKDTFVLLPPGISYDKLDTNPIGRVYRTVGSSTRLRGWKVGINNVRRLPYVSVALDGNRVIPGSRSHISLPHVADRNPMDPPQQPYAAHFSLEVPMDDAGRHDIRVLFFDNPFCRSQPGRGAVSNTIFLR